MANDEYDVGFRLSIYRAPLVPNHDANVPSLPR
jgi:hypothetical protein